MAAADDLGSRPDAVDRLLFGDVDAAKRELRASALARRAALPAAALAAAERDLCRVTLTDVVPAEPTTVALYVSMEHEPGTHSLRAALAAAGHRILLPVLGSDLDLDWAVDSGDLQPGLRGTREPTGPHLGTDAVAEASVVLVPGLLAGRDGTRLGRGGGSYDRALTRRGSAALIAMLCWPDEIVETLPHEPHDARIGAALTPAGLIRLGAP